MTIQSKRGDEATEAWVASSNEHVCIRVPPGCKMVLENEYHGDHDDDWLVCYGRDGKETARHNMRYCSSVVWK